MKIGLLRRAESGTEIGWARNRERDQEYNRPWNQYWNKDRGQNRDKNKSELRAEPEPEARSELQLTKIKIVCGIECYELISRT
ncbi:hypothetical protein EVAR_57542_1 [Eumeta japonica]|uniref:Uncharacterized protein n=1 Tax=Eumeta variegata TaxID=151549 RepID=A0A4C1Y0B0_EUMVA|nr:hypothetical protein EVAR_57542_1 [Eumeta japonica]